MRATRLAALVFLVLLGCADLKAVVTLQRDMTARFGLQSSINITNRRILTVTFVNASEEQVPLPARAAFADSVAVFVASRYPRFDSLETLKIEFSQVRGTASVNFTRTEVPFTYTPAQVRALGRDSAATQVASPASN